MKFRALISQDVSAGAAAAGFIVVNANKDTQITRITGSLGASPVNPTMMVLSNNRQMTLAVDISGQTVQLVNNKGESLTGSPVNVQGTTESRGDLR